MQDSASHQVQKAWEFYQVQHFQEKSTDKMLLLIKTIVMQSNISKSKQLLWQDQCKAEVFVNSTPVIVIAAWKKNGPNFQAT